MIALKDGLPVIELGSGQAIAFDHDWLLRSLNLAAQRAGYAKWWLAEHVAESVTNYLREQREVNVVPVDRLTKAVQAVLQVIGYGEVGQHFVPAPPRELISLVELAREAGAGYELAFFTQLRVRLQDLLREKHACFELIGLEPCIKLLRARKVWSRECAELRAEIVAFTRDQTVMLAAGREVTFSLQ